MLLRGEAGIGKSALLDYVSGQASGCRVVSVAGVESEMELAFAGLHQLCGPMLDRLDGLAGPQCEALRVAFGLADGGVPDRFLVGLAVLSLLSDAAEEQPLVCLIDDVQWLDGASVQAVAFVARRLMAEQVGVVMTVREPSDLPELGGLPTLVVEGLADGDARRVLVSATRARLDEQVVDRIVAETRGNPLALLELPGSLSPAELAGGFGLPAAALSGRIEESFRRRLEALSAPTRRLLLVAAAEPVGEPVLVWRAAGRLGLGTDAATAAIEAGLVEFGSRVRFRHPLVRSAVYRSAPLAERQLVHRVLAEETDAGLDPDRRAWHRAQATTGPDEDVAVELERSAGRARARGGVAAAAAFLERASALTPDPARRGDRALAAAQAKHQAGAFDAALDLVAIAEREPLDARQRANVDLLRGQIAFSSSHGSDAPPLLLRAAQRLEALDVELARDTYLEALVAALFAGRFAQGGGLLEVAEAMRAAPAVSDPPDAKDQLLHARAVRITAGAALGVPMEKQALHAFCSEDRSYADGLRWLDLGCRTAIDVWDFAAWDALSTRLVDATRDAGALAALPFNLIIRMVWHLFAGEFTAAAALIDEAAAITEAIGTAPMGSLLVGWRGQASALELIAAGTQDAATRGEGRAVTGAAYSSAVVHNSLGHYDQALAAARQATERREDSPFSYLGLAELIEAAARTGDTETAADALERLSEATGASGTDWALGIEARSPRCSASTRRPRACTARRSPGSSGPAYTLESTRAHLLYGEYLRREGRRLDARRQLRLAHDLFGRMGADAFAERARRELRATGETLRPRSVEAVVALTAQETQIARIGARRPYQPRDRRPALHQPQDRRVAPAQRVHQAGHHVAQGTASSTEMSGAESPVTITCGFSRPWSVLRRCQRRTLSQLL